MQISNGDKLHIGIFGRVNSGKSSLLNAISGQSTAIVSDVRGTTTDPVYKPMEINGLGAVRLIDTAGMDDESELGTLRNAATDKVISAIDVAVIVCGGLAHNDAEEYESVLVDKFTARKIPYVTVYNYVSEKSDENTITYDNCRKFDNFMTVNALTGDGIAELIEKIKQLCDNESKSALRLLVKSGDTVVLVMPQDSSAPKGRLILPQVRAIRELLDINAQGVVCNPSKLNDVLHNLKNLPDLVITDSQVFAEVASILPNGVRLTSFSVLLSAEKGDIAIFKIGADSMDNLNAESRVLIAEACAHVPQNEDIGRVKIPAMLKKKYNVSQITHCNGNDFPEDLSGYNLVIHCGACMFNRRLVMTRINQCVNSGVPITNYGMAIAKMQGILDKIVLPKTNAIR